MNENKGVSPQLPQRSSRCSAQLGSDPFIADRLSAYIDNELAAEDVHQIEQHCSTCEMCRVLVSQYRAIGTLMRQSEVHVDTEHIWERVSARLDDGPIVPISTRYQPKNWVYAMLATAASIALIWFVAKSNLLSEHGDETHKHAVLAVDFQEVIRSAKNEPRTAVAKLVAKYQGKELDSVATADYLGYVPAVFNRVPAGFARASTHVLNMPCCKCSASICKRNDGTSLILFEHKDEQPVWFGDSPSIETQCSGKTCKIIETAGQLAVSWKNQDRQLTIVGASDIAEVNQWVASLSL